MPIVRLHGHSAVFARLHAAFVRGTLPSSILLHGPAAIGKQRLALEVGRMLVCTADPASAPCGECQGCRYAGEFRHPDLHWFFPRPRLTNTDADAAKVRDDIREGIRERVATHGLYTAPSGTEGIYVASIRAIVQSAAMTPALGRRKVFVVGDAERMVSQEGSDQAANAFLKLLEEPPADTTLILTSSEAGALLATIRSRVVSVRVAPLPDAAVESFLADPAVTSFVPTKKSPTIASGSTAELLALAGGAPGRLLSDESPAKVGSAERMIEAATGRGRASLYRAAFIQGSSKARGGFADSLEALTGALHHRVRRQTARGEDGAAYRATLAVSAIELAKDRARGNVSPQLIAATLLRELRDRLT